MIMWEDIKIKSLLRYCKSQLDYLRYTSAILPHVMFKGGGDIAKWSLVRQLAACSSLPAISLNVLLGERFRFGIDESIMLHPSSAGGGSTAWYETVLLSILVKAIKPKTILEIGTFEGRTTWHLFKNSPENSVIYTLDLPDSEVPEDISDKGLAKNKRRPYLPESERIKLILADSRKWEGQLDNRVQFAFIDASHRYEDVKNDTEKVFQCLDEMACVCWHDCLWKDGYGVHRYLHELRERGYNIFRVQDDGFDISSIAIYLTPVCAERKQLKQP